MKKPTKKTESDIQLDKLNIFDVQKTDKLIKKLQENRSETTFLEKELRKEISEKRHKANLASYLLELSQIALFTVDLNEAVESKNTKKTQELLKQLKKNLQNIDLKTEEHRDLFRQIQESLEPIFSAINRNKNTPPHLLTEVKNLRYMLQEKQTPKRWKPAA